MSAMQEARRGKENGSQVGRVACVFSLSDRQESQFGHSALRFGSCKQFWKTAMSKLPRWLSQVFRMRRFEGAVARGFLFAWKSDTLLES